MRPHATRTARGKNTSMGTRSCSVQRGHCLAVGFARESVRTTCVYFSSYSQVHLFADRKRENFTTARKCMGFEARTGCNARAGPACSKLRRRQKDVENTAGARWCQMPTAVPCSECPTQTAQKWVTKRDAFCQILGRCTRTRCEKGAHARACAARAGETGEHMYTHGWHKAYKHATAEPAGECGHKPRLQRPPSRKGGVPCGLSAKSRSSKDKDPMFSS